MPVNGVNCRVPVTPSCQAAHRGSVLLWQLHTFQAADQAQLSWSDMFAADMAAAWHPPHIWLGVSQRGCHHAAASGVAPHRSSVTLDASCCPRRRGCLRYWDPRIVDNAVVDLPLLLVSGATAFVSGVTPVASSDDSATATQRCRVASAPGASECADQIATQSMAS